MKTYYVGIDQGTTGTTILVTDGQMNIAAKSYREHQTRFPHPGWNEQDPLALWDLLRDGLKEALEQAGISMGDVRSIGVDHQGESVMLWDRQTGKPVYPAILWQDKRTAEAVDSLTREQAALIQARTGLVPDSYFSATKIKWILDHVPGVKELARGGRILAGTLDTWMLWKLSGGRVHRTDHSTASRTMLFNIHALQWDEALLELLEIPRAILPEICDSAGVLGYTDPAELGARVPISGCLVDQQAALFGQACFAPGMIKATYGTGCFILMNTGETLIRSDNGLLSTVGWKLPSRPPTFALDGGIYIAGAAIQWLRDGLQIIDSSRQVDLLGESVADTGGVYFVPAFSGLGAPYWDQHARGTIVGITGGTTKAHLARATLESIAYQVKDILDVMQRDSGFPIPAIRADGGCAVSSFLMQFQADILGIPVEVPVNRELTALGAAGIAAVGMGDIGELEELAGFWKLAHRYEPRMSEDQRETLLRRWHDAVGRSAGWAQSRERDSSVTVS